MAQSQSDDSESGSQEGCASITTCSTYPLMMVPSSDTATQFFNVQIWLSQQLQHLHFPDPVHMTYKPMEYAGGLYFYFLQRFCRAKKHILILGMNPGPWGMGQTGIPFGDIDTVKNYLGLEELGGFIGQPSLEHPAKRVMGLKCHRKEVSGAKLWGMIKKLTHNCPAQQALSNIVVHNFCPLIFMGISGRNLTPDELKADSSKEQLFNLCATALNYSMDVLGCKYVISVGRFAEKRARSVVKSYNKSQQVLEIPHPSPRNAASRANWEENVISILSAANLLPEFTKP